MTPPLSLNLPIKSYGQPLLCLRSQGKVNWRESSTQQCVRTLGVQSTTPTCPHVAASHNTQGKSRSPSTRTHLPTQCPHPVSNTVLHRKEAGCFTGLVVLCPGGGTSSNGCGASRCCQKARLPSRMSMWP